jgi:hypothetical protein
MRQILYLSLVTFFAFSCDNKAISDSIESAHADASVSLEQDRKVRFDSLTKSWTETLASCTDSIEKQKVNLAYRSCSSFVDYIDSLTILLKAIQGDDHLPVENIFVHQSHGDTLLARLRESYGRLLSITKSKESREIIAARKINSLPVDENESYDNMTSKKFLLFKMHSSEAQQWTLYGLESELMSSGIIAFKDNVDNKTTANSR